MYQVAVCDDDAKDGRHICGLAEQILQERGIEAQISLFHSPGQLLSDIETMHSRYDLFLLDILMGETNGIELAQILRGSGSRGVLIYTTSSRDYAIDGYKVQASGYLLKPIEKDALDTAIGRILARRDAILVESEGVLKTLLLSDIQYAEALGHYVTLRTGQGEAVKLRATLTEVQRRLGAARFVRCHKGYLVNLAQVREVGTNHILLHGGTTIPLGRQYRYELQKGMVRYMERAVPL